MPHHAHRLTLFEGGTARVDVRLSRIRGIAEVRLWRGTRWPSVEGRWFATMSWFPWYSLETQARKAMMRASDHPPTLLTWQEVRAALRRFTTEYETQGAE